MSTNKHATIRYQALDKCFRNSMRKYFIDDLVDACNKAISGFDPSSEGVKKRQVYSDINFMQSLDGYDAPIEKEKIGRSVYYFYSDLDFTINKQPLTESEAIELKETLITLNRFKGLPQFEWMESMTTRLEASFHFGEKANQIIEFEQNEFLKGQDYIRELYHAIVNKIILQIQYKSFKSEENVSIKFHPYYLKQYNNRWFVFGKNPDYNNITNLALDRISEIMESADKNYVETDIDFMEYFEDILGVTFEDESELCKITLRIDQSLWPYIKTKPIHGSQKLVYKSDNFVDISLELIPNYELESTILQYGEKIIVLEPIELRKKISDKVDKMKFNYKSE